MHFAISQIPCVMPFLYKAAATAQKNYYFLFCLLSWGILHVCFHFVIFFYCIKKWSSREKKKKFMTERKISGNAVKTKFINYVFALHKIAMEGPTKQDTKKNEGEKKRCNEILCTRILWVFIFIILQVIKLHIFFVERQLYCRCYSFIFCLRVFCLPLFLL